MGRPKKADVTVKKPRAKNTKKNLKLLKDLPSVVLNGVTYKLPAGTVLKGIGGSKYSVLGTIPSTRLYSSSRESEDYIIHKGKGGDNEGWWEPTANKPTHGIIKIGSHVVKFSPNHINIGCQKVTKAQVKEILTKLEE